MAKIILVFGLPNSGKTMFSQQLIQEMSYAKVEHINAKDVRSKYNDGDYSASGQIRQAEIMYKLAKESTADYAICDFVCPIASVRKLFGDCYRIFMNTIKSSPFDGANKMFQVPDANEIDMEIKTFDKIKYQAHIISAIHQYQLFSFPAS